jgi:putative phosphoribosyl transferase
LRGPKSPEIVPGASHLFQEAGAIEAATGLAAGWFEKYLGHDGGRADTAFKPGRS